MLYGSQPFLPVEKEATLLHLLMARSGIYLPTANRELTDLSRGAARTRRVRISSV